MTMPKKTEQKLQPVRLRIITRRGVRRRLVGHKMSAITVQPDAETRPVIPGIGAVVGGGGGAPWRLRAGVTRFRRIPTTSQTVPVRRDAGVQRDGRGEPGDSVRSGARLDRVGTNRSDQHKQSRRGRV